MIVDFATALDAARTLARVDDLARDLWTAYAAGAIVDADAERVGAAIEEARLRIRPKDTVAVRAPAVPRLASSFPPRRRRCASVRTGSRRDSAPPAGLLRSVTPCPRRRVHDGPARAFSGSSETRYGSGGSALLPLGAIAARAGVGVATARRHYQAGRWRRPPRHHRTPPAGLPEPTERAARHLTGMVRLDREVGTAPQGPILQTPRRQTSKPARDGAYRRRGDRPQTGYGACIRGYRKKKERRIWRLSCFRDIVLSGKP